MSRSVAYLQIPEVYCQHIGGLRWSIGGDAIEDSSGELFAFNREVALFLEGMAASDDLIHFGFVLHLMQMLGYGALPFSKVPSGLLLKEYVAAGRPLRHAGAFCSILCRGVPPSPTPPDPAEVRLQLTSGAVLSDVGAGSWSIRSDGMAVWRAGSGLELPPLNPEEFKQHVESALEAYPAEEIRSWLRNGRGPLRSTGDRLAQELQARRPRSIGEVLESLVERPRLTGAASLVSTLTGALTLPPRRLSRKPLPSGGYGDVSNRGNPERLLLSQHALDPLEFLRRFAENELLYYQKEEPQAPNTEELLVLLDQGVRTWGVVRLALSAAVLAFGRLADRRGLPLRLATTSNGGEWLDPLKTDSTTLSELLEASDLSPNPGLAIERAMEQGTPDLRRDLVLLSHPRNLAEPDVSAATLRAGPNLRLFALTVEEHGAVQFCEMRHGRPLTLASFRVDWPKPEKSKPSQSVSKEAIGLDRPWTGAIEPVGFPFRFGLQNRLEHPRFDFDTDSERLLLAGSNGMLYAWNIQRNDLEILPRGLFEGQVLEQVDTVLGVAGGFIVTGRINDQTLVFHYQFSNRQVKVYSPGPLIKNPLPWIYCRDPHTVVALGSDQSSYWFMNLSRGQCWRLSSEEMDASASQVSMSWMKSMGNEVSPRLHVLHDDDTVPVFGWIRLQRKTGTLELQGRDTQWGPSVPLVDGMPLLAGCRIERALVRGNCLAMVVDRSPSSLSQKRMIYLFRGPDFTLLSERLTRSQPIEIALSANGRLLALPRGGGRVFEILETNSNGPPLWVAPRGGSHQRIDLEMGRDWLAVWIGSHANLVRWGRGQLEIEGRSGATDVLGASQVISPECSPSFGIARKGRLPEWVQYDSRRFISTCRGSLIAVVDRFGQVVLFDLTGELVCMFFAFQGRVAAWLPDGTRLGPAELIGGPSTPGASEWIARALQAATDLPGASMS